VTSTFSILSDAADPDTTNNIASVTTAVTVDGAALR
jgi:hypothetical protein